MAIVTLEYNSTISNLIQGQWQIDDYLVGAQLVSSGYTHSPSHTTRSDVEAFAVGPVVQVSGKTAAESDGVTVIDCADIDFTVNGTYSAAWVVLHELGSSTAESTDKLMFAIKLNSEVALDIDVDSSLRIGINGLLRIVQADYEIPPVVDIPVDDGVPVITPGKTLDDPAAWVSGDVISVTDAEVDAFALDGYNFDQQVTVWAPNGVRIIGTDANSVPSHVGRACVYVTNCTNIRFVGFNVDSIDSTVAGGFIINQADGIHIESCTASFLKIWGIYYDACSDIKVDNCETHDMGQEGIICQLSTDIECNKWRVTNNKVYNTGLNTSPGRYYGEGIYLGSGTFPNYGPVRDVICDNNEVYNCLAEGIDCKSNVVQGRITNNYVHDCILPYNAAITVGSENEPGPAGIVSTDLIVVENNITENITPVDGSEFKVFAHIVVGKGNVSVRDNDLRGGSFGEEYGVSIFRTAVNQDQNDVFLGPNQYGDIDPLQRVSINLFNADLGAVDNPMDFFYIPNVNLEPIMHYDFSQSNELTLAGSKVSVVNDLSGGGYHMPQTDDAKRPTIDTRTINGVQAAEFDENQYFLIEDGPQLYDKSMIFAVVDSDDLAASRWILSLQDGSSERIGVGVDSNGFWFQHNLTTSGKINVAATSGPKVIACYRDGSKQYITDGSNAQENELGLDMRTITRWAIGAIIFNSSQSRQFDGAIGEIKVYDFYDADKFNSERAALAAKWGI